MYETVSFNTSCAPSLVLVPAPILALFHALVPALAQSPTAAPVHLFHVPLVFLFAFFLVSLQLLSV